MYTSHFKNLTYITILDITLTSQDSGNSAYSVVKQGWEGVRIVCFRKTQYLIPTWSEILNRRTLMPLSKVFKKKLPALTRLRVQEFTKKKLKLLPLLVVITVGTFTFANNLFFFSVSGTYIEGIITQDTIWTLTDSPLVVSGNITVSPNATLTIEPCVEVKFGGDFSLIVNGQLIANGIQDKIITFTSNKDQPEAGDWNAIEFIGIQQSVLAFCSVKYAKNGITIEDGNVRIQNCEIGNNLENGMIIENSIVEAKNNEIVNNSLNGIYITGDNQVTIQNNTIRSNTNGILLTGNLTTGVNMEENIVMSNTLNGIQLDANDYSNINILNNILSANDNGFYVSGQANTYITKNSISYNTVGIFYENRSDHVAYYNDIYGNDYGMDVAPNATVNAEYNYWGHESGPYHVSLNPTGKGNPVCGDGVNLDFIFFLTAPIGYINERPTARLLTDKKVVSPNQIVTFIATTSSDDRHVDQCFYDFGDGKDSGWTTLTIFVHKYSLTGTYHANLKVMDDFGVISNNVATVEIACQALPPLDVSLTPSNYIVDSEGQVSITVHATKGTSPVESANVVLFPIIGGSFEPSEGLTDSTGYFTTTFSAPNVTQTTNVRIIATVSKADCADGSDYKYLMVLPPLSVKVVADPDRIKLGVISHVTVHVTHNGLPVSNATVSIASDGGGNFDYEIGSTDASGECAFTFTPPPITTPINITLTAAVEKTGYAESEGTTTVSVDLGTLNVQVTASPATVESKATSTVTVHVTYDLDPVENAVVTVSSDVNGTFSVTNATTNENGYCTFVFTAPQTTTLIDITVTATATKSGYIEAQNQRKITVNPAAPTGLPLTTIIVVAAVIIVTAIVLVLFGLRIIVISWKEV